MKVTLSDPLVTVQGWIPALDKVGCYTLKVRKTPAEMKEERRLRQLRYGDGARKVNQMRYEQKSVLAHDKDDPSTVRFLPGLWPRVRHMLDKLGIQYELEDKRNPDIRPPLDVSKLAGVEFRERQDEALALIANSDCGIIATATGFGKCLHGDTGVLMYDGSIKEARLVKVGDLLMGDDSTPRKVLTTNKGHGRMYRFEPVKGLSYVFNDKHVLSLVNCGNRPCMSSDGSHISPGGKVDISIEDYLKLNKKAKHLLKAYRVPVDFPDRAEPELDPYFVGAYLGDGTEAYGMLTNPDCEVLDFCAEYAETQGWFVQKEASPNGRNCTALRFTEPDRSLRKSAAPIVAIRRNCGMSTEVKGRSIIDDYKLSSRENRFKLLAGLLDTDGYLKSGSVFEISTKWDKLAEDIMFLAGSLGFAVRDNYGERVCCNTGAKGMYHRITISGDTHLIPTRVPRKQACVRRLNKDVLHTGFKLEPVGDDDYYGFTVDGNHRFVLKDFTVTHNSFLISLLCKAYPTLNIVVTTSSTQVVGTLCEYLSKVLPGEVGVLSGGKDTTAGKRIVVSTLKSLSNIPPEKVQLLFVDECHAIGDNVAGQDVMKFCWARRFGFSASPVRNDGTAKVMESILGPVIMKMGYEEAAQAGMVTPMKFTMLPCTDCPPVARNMDLPEPMLKRWNYWSNNSRNRVIRNFIYDLKKVYDGQILVMVGTLEAAINLHLMLPWFTVAYYGSANMEEIRKHFPQSRYPGLDLSKYKSSQKNLDRIRGAFAKGTLRYVISTKVFKQGCNFSHLQVLVRADGDVSAIEGIQIPGRLARLDEGKACAYLVDVDDMFNPWASGRAKARKRQYLEQQWTEISCEEMLNDIGGSTENDDEGSAGEPRVR